MYTVQDHPPPPSEFLLLPSLDNLYKVYVWNQELPQSGDSPPVMSPSQHALSQQMMKKWIPRETNIRKSNNPRMIQQLAFHTQQIIKTTSTQDLDPLSLDNNDHTSVLPFEMYVLESGNHLLATWIGNLWFLSHIQCPTNDERFSLSLWEVWFWSTLGAPIPVLIGPSQMWDCNVIFQKPQEQDDRLPSPRTRILDFTLTHTCYGRSHVYPIGQLTHTRSSDGTLDPVVIYGRWLEKRFYIIVNCILIVQTPYPFYQLQLILQTTFMMTLVVYCSYMLTVKNRIYLTKYRRNRINFVFFVLFSMLILRCQ